MQKILLVDYSVYKDSLKKMLIDDGYAVDLTESAYDAMAKLNSIDYDLIVSEVNLPGDNAFDLYNYIMDQYPYLPTIMTTDDNIEKFFDKIFQEGIGNVICKPVNKFDFLQLISKLITRKNIFGLKNYLPNLIEQKKVSISSSRQIKRAIELVIEHIQNWGFVFSQEDLMAITLVLNEMTINAVYHSHGFTEEKERRKPVVLPDGQVVELFFAYSKDAYAISITDYNGVLSKEKILSSMNSVVEQNQLIERATETGEDVFDLLSETGRGIDLVRKLAGEYYFVIKKGERTEIILIFDASFDSDDNENYSSLKIIEDLG